MSKYEVLLKLSLLVLDMKKVTETFQDQNNLDEEIIKAIDTFMSQAKELEKVVYQKGENK